MSAFSPLLASLLAAWTAPHPQVELAQPAPVQAAAPLPSGEDAWVIWARLAREFREGESGQVRIEQHIIWRIAPMPGRARQDLTALNAQPPAIPRMIERKMGECIPMASIAGGRPQSGSRLLLFLRDRRWVAANLEKACAARDFYSGFYVDKPNSDGKLCVDRDRILARNGARCEISSFRLLIAADDD